MEVGLIKERLHQFIDTIDDKRAIALYMLFEDEIISKEDSLEIGIKNIDNLSSEKVNSNSLEDFKKMTEQKRSKILKEFFGSVKWNEDPVEFQRRLRG